MADRQLEQVAFAAGCFWGVELAYQRVPGVTKTSVGYTQGHLAAPTYGDVCRGRSGHAEAVLVEYDPREVDFQKLLDLFWGRHNPTQLNRQGNDVGSQYRSGIYFYTPEQEKMARASLQREEEKRRTKIVTEIKPASTFYPAEEYHQKYLSKGGRFKKGQSDSKGCTDPIRCYG